MSRCPTDGPVLKSILGLHRPAADCLLSLSFAVSTFYHFPSPPICFSSSYSHPPPPISSISPSVSSPMSISLPLSCPISPSFTFSSSSLSYLWPHPAIVLLFFGLSRCHRTNHSVSSICLSITLFFLSPLLIVSLSPGVSLPGS